MSTVEEIEKAIEKLPVEKVDQVAVWIDSYLKQVKGHSDPILTLGESPVVCGIRDASTRHDIYLSGQ
ncbi:MAG: hypothetical protein HC904_08065 [Blastochloris sp.]|nr:hypothetical protein [Blastochloris sp.]